MRLVLTSDTHGTLPRIEDIPACDYLIHAGDISPVENHNLDHQLEYLDRTFREWLDRLQTGPVKKHVIGVAGNHDFVFEHRLDTVTDLGLPWVYLQDDAETFEGVKFHGHPWVPNLSRWAFHAEDQMMQDKLADIPDDVDVLISHGPPHMVCDKTCPTFGNVHAGDPYLPDEIRRIDPRLVVCGHIHEAYGVGDIRNARSGSYVPIYNVSHMTEVYDAENAPVIFDL